MNENLNKLLKVIEIYVGYLLLTIIIFYAIGLYVFNMPPTKLVLIRIVIFPTILTSITIVLISLIKNHKNKN